ncbi:hypothetical protein GCM10010420_03440 [Streptomyces glaucosporus]|uniref:Uncharacterized protein n=1 Tax=Streptomyces glaucosporus TaxID=284044 RepID=A0ABP5UNF1_9ACTN
MLTAGRRTGHLSPLGSVRAAPNPVGRTESGEPLPTTGGETPGSPATPGAGQTEEHT